MKPIITRRRIYAFSIIILATFLAACGSNTATSTTVAQSGVVATPTRAVAPTQSPASKTGGAATPTQAAVPTQSPASKTGTTFKQLTGANFTIDYPAGWQMSQKSLPGGASGVKNPAPENIYGFVASDNITGLHIVRNGDEQAVGGMINELLGGQFSCNMGNSSVPSQVMVGGVTWSQADLVCMIHNSNFEVRELVTSSAKYNQTVIMYGAYQQVGNGALAPDFAHASTMYFNPMLASFKFN
jgi:hypothetical protein